jgi:hypothetical protein
LTPTAGGAVQQQSGAGRFKIKSQQIRSLRFQGIAATLIYYFKDGRVVRERTAYGLVNEGGRLKISSSTVLSSVTL